MQSRSAMTTETSKQYGQHLQQEQSSHKRQAQEIATNNKKNSTFLECLRVSYVQKLSYTIIFGQIVTRDYNHETIVSSFTSNTTRDEVQSQF